MVLFLAPLHFHTVNTPPFILRIAGINGSSIESSTGIVLLKKGTKWYHNMIR